MTRYIERVDFHRFLRSLRQLLILGLVANFATTGALWLTLGGTTAWTPVLIGHLAILLVFVGGSVSLIGDKLKEARGDKEDRP